MLRGLDADARRYEGRERDQSAATRERVDTPAGERGNADEDVIRDAQRHCGL